MNYIHLILCAVIGYLLGCIPVGVLISKMYADTDIRKTGSGNSGTTNVLRTLGWLPSILTLAGDCVKGILGAYIGKTLGGETGMLLGGLCAVLGHDFPVFMRFKGGKGIATSLGMILVISPVLALSLLAVELVIVAVTRYMSLASISVTVAYPLLNVILFRGHENYGLFVFFSIVCGLLSLYCHRGNLMRLIRGDRILLLSDGVFGTLSDDELISMMDLPPQAAAEAAVQAVDAKRREHQDNATIVIVEIE